MTEARRRRNYYQHRQRHRLAALLICLPLSIVALTGCVLALKEPLNASGLFGTRDPWPFLYDLHRGLLSGFPGRVLISMIGLGVSLMVISGLKSFVRIKGRKPSLHAILGIALGVPVALVTGIGAVLNFSEPLSNWLDPIPNVASVGITQGSTPLQTDTKAVLVRQVVGKIRPDEDATMRTMRLWLGSIRLS